METKHRPQKSWIMDKFRKFYRRRSREQPDHKRSSFCSVSDPPKCREIAQNSECEESKNVLLEIEPFSHIDFKDEDESSRSSASAKRTNIYVKRPTRRTSDIKYIEEDESESSELIAISGVDSRESSTAPRGDILPEYEVEELKEMLRSPPTTLRKTPPPSPSPPSSPPLPLITIDDDSSSACQLEKSKSDMVLVLLNHSPGLKRKCSLNPSLLQVPESQPDMPMEHVYSAVSENPTTLRSSLQAALGRSRSSSPDVPARRRTFGESENLRRLQSSPFSEQKEEEEALLEALRQVVRKCSNSDPLKRPTSNDLVEMLSSIQEKS